MKPLRTHNIITAILASLIVAIAFCSCGNKNKNARTDTYASGKATIMSDESFSPIIDEELQVFHATYPDAEITPVYTNELDEMNALMKQEVHLVITARNFNEKELNYFKTNGLQPRYFPIGYDGLAFIINKENVDSCIHVDDIKKILSGQSTQWNQVNPGSKLGEIDVVFDNNKSAAVHWAVDSILDGKPINSKNITAVKTSTEVINYVEKTKNAIGIIGSNWLNDKRDSTNLTFKKEVRPMYVSRAQKANISNSYQPFQYYFYTDDYPLVRTAYILLSDPRRGVATTFKNFIISQNQGQLIVLKAGLLPAYGEITLKEVHVK